MMDDIISWSLAILVIIAYLLPTVLGFLFTAGTIGFAVWTIADTPNLMGIKGEINRGFKVSSRPLPNKAKHYLNNLPGNAIEYLDPLIERDISGVIRKQENEVLILAKQWQGFRWRRSWPFIGYVNLSLSNPVLEIRSSLPFHLFLTSLSLSIVLLPFIVGMYAVSFSVETQAIEKYLRNKYETLPLDKTGESL